MIQVLQALKRYRTAHQAIPMAVPVPVPPQPPPPPARRRCWAITVVGMPGPQEPSENQLVDEAIVAAARAGTSYHIGDVPPASPFPDGQVIGTVTSPRW